MRRQYYSATAGRLCDCGSNKPKIYRCMDCTVNVPWCEACMVAKHYYEPLHAIERWTERHFVRDSLYKLGLIYHLGHGGSRCTELGKNATPSNVSVTDINGTHKVRIMYCLPLYQREAAFSSTPRRRYLRILREVSFRWIHDTLLAGLSYDCTRVEKIRVRLRESAVSEDVRATV